MRDFLTYNETIKGKSATTIAEYYHDLQTFFRYLKLVRGLSPSDIDFSDIQINDVDINLLKTVSLSDLFSFLVYCKNERGNNPSTRARKSSTLRMFFKYLSVQTHAIEINPAEMLDTPKLRKSLPVHLTLEESIDLLNAIDGIYKKRDFCMLIIFLNCGLRLSELCGLNLSDIKDDGSVKILGKGNKERIVYLNDACIAAINDYLPTRPVEGVKPQDKNALFLSRLKKRISNKTVQLIVYQNLAKAGLSGKGFSTHKLRHTAATLMYQHGNVDIRVLKDILGHENLGTTQIYTHVSNSQAKNAIFSNPLSNIIQKEKTKQTP